MTKAKLVARINTLVGDGLFTYDDIEMDIDGAIDEINDTLNANFPPMSEVFDSRTDDDYLYEYTYEDADGNTVTESRPIFPEKYQRKIVVNYVVSQLFRRDLEFGPEYQTAKNEVSNGLMTMFRDHFTKIPERFLADEAGGVFMTNPNATDDEDDSLPDVPLNPSLPDDFYE